MTVETLVGDLGGGRLYTIPDALDLAPRSAGFYAWWCAPGARPGVAGERHPAEPFELLYVGIAPARATSRATIHSRIRQHATGNVGASTFRFTLASLLWRSQRWTPQLSGSGTVRLEPAENAVLSGWMVAHLRVSWTEFGEPWTVENLVVPPMGPPLNRQHNLMHPFYDSTGDARTAFRSAAAKHA